MMTKETVHSNLAIPPGEYLEEVLEELGMSKEELARRMGRPSTKLSHIFKGEKAITPETALQLEKVVGVSAHIWTGLEAEYRLTQARLEQNREELRLKDEIGLVSKYPYNELVKTGNIARHTKPIDKVRELQAYFGVVSLTSIPAIQRYQAVFRVGKSKKGERTPEAISSWLRMGERIAQRTNCAPYNETRLRNSLKDLRSMTLEMPETFQDRLHKLLAECGVALVICPHFPKTMTHGATFWLGKDKAVLMITIRFKWADIFWFSMFHEIGHILLHGRQALILENDRGDIREDEADAFAGDMLIPSDHYQRFISRGLFYTNNILEFANKVSIHPGCVVGRLQHDNFLKPQWGNDLRLRFEWIKDK